uniref:miraculin-like n=1 Tax=Erigeron canadensis TaxID=72917 RepID=UPI001CB8C102|nr:miraculin-like [Erigeron canadensis]
MKITTLLSLAFIYSVFPASSALDSVLDITGKNLHSGTNYYIMPAARGGGIILGPTGVNKTCPLGIAQLQTNKYGLPLTFTPVNPKKRIIRLSTDVNIKFSGHTNCNKSNIWKLKYDEVMRQYFVKVGGVEGNPGRETLDNWFKIEKAENGYKLVFCPTVCNFCKVLCRDVGIFVDDNGKRRLALSYVPFSVIFIAK